MEVIKKGQATFTFIFCKKVACPFFLFAHCSYDFIGAQFIVPLQQLIDRRDACPTLSGEF